MLLVKKSGGMIDERKNNIWDYGRSCLWQAAFPLLFSSGKLEDLPMKYTHSTNMRTKKTKKKKRERGLNYGAK